ncbi:hypothetical protein [Streptomyces formicae]|uniref:hypothetical protein n=1 Tax=Streptomyces formicae TaxID=1616117 RepID=UPI00360B9063
MEEVMPTRNIGSLVFEHGPELFRGQNIKRTARHDDATRAPRQAVHARRVVMHDRGAVLAQGARPG